MCTSEAAKGTCCKLLDVAMQAALLVMLLPPSAHLCPPLPPQVTGVFARRGYNVQSLAVGACEKHNLSRICMVVPGTEESIQKLFKQLSKLVYVQSMTDLTHMPFLYRELMLVKVRVWTGRKVWGARCTPFTNHT